MDVNTLALTNNQLVTEENLIISPMRLRTDLFAYYNSVYSGLLRKSVYLLSLLTKFNEISDISVRFIINKLHYINSPA